MKDHPENQCLPVTRQQYVLGLIKSINRHNNNEFGDINAPDSNLNHAAQRPTYQRRRSTVSDIDVMRRNWSDAGAGLVVGDNDV